MYGLCFWVLRHHLRTASLHSRVRGLLHPEQQCDIGPFCIGGAHPMDVMKESLGCTLNRIAFDGLLHIRWTRL
jgi:hypothetical protein